MNMLTYEVVKSTSFETMNKTEKRVAINERNEAEKTNTMCLLIKTDVLIIIFFSREWDVDLL